jgi:anhydro-N-acetylmuramic acid kinase
MLVAGLISGTSADGIDVALVEISGAGFDQKVTTVAFGTTPYPPRVREAVLAISNAATHTAELSQLNFLLGELFAEAIARTVGDAGLGLADLELVGSHGQTIYHQAVAGDCHGRSVASTLQIGEAAVIAERTGVPVVADFRTADVAAAGQGAPLVPYVDYLLYRDAARGRVSLNIGGIANVTAIPAAGGPDEVLAFDTGPGNMIIDALIAHISGGEQKYDDGGRLADFGKVDEALLGELMGHPYFAEAPPKSAGREQFGREYVATLLSRGLDGRDMIATATAFTSRSIADAIQRFVAPRMRVDDLIVSGGGLHNPVILGGLAERLPGVNISPSDDLGVNSDGKEAIAFAILAHESFHRRPANLPSATGARHPCILGKLSWPPPPTE